MAAATNVTIAVAGAIVLEIESYLAPTPAPTLFTHSRDNTYATTLSSSSPVSFLARSLGMRSS